MFLDSYSSFDLDGSDDRGLPDAPAEGGGVHFWLFRVACLMWRQGRNATEIAGYLNERSPRVDKGEIEDAIRNAAKAVGIKGTGTDGFDFGEHQGAREKKMPTARVDEALLGKLLRDDPDAICRLPFMSPDNPAEFTCAQIIDRLFPGDPFVCLSGPGGPATAFTARRQEWRGQEQLRPLIVPNPMTARSGLNQSGKETARSLANTGPRRYLVVESDYKKNQPGGIQTQAAVIRHLAANFRCPALVCFSGNGSLHTWFPVLPGDSDGPGGSLFQFHEYCVSLGCDPATWVRCQLVRTPGAWRNNRCRQVVVYLDLAQVHRG